jgi:hypothetical protein
VSQKLAVRRDGWALRPRRRLHFATAPSTNTSGVAALRPSGPLLYSSRGAYIGAFS